jgi:hypothetical protein
MRLDALYRSGNRPCELRGQIGLPHQLDVAINDVINHDAGAGRCQRTFHSVESVSAGAVCPRVLDRFAQAATQMDSRRSLFGEIENG